MRHRLQWFIHLRAHGLRKGDEMSTPPTLLMGYGTPLPDPRLWYESSPGQIKRVGRVVTRSCRHTSRLVLDHPPRNFPALSVIAERTSAARWRSGEWASPAVSSSAKIAFISTDQLTGSSIQQTAGGTSLPLPVLYPRR